MTRPCPLCSGAGHIILTEDWRDPGTCRLRPAGTKIRCECCDGWKRVQEDHERLFGALSRCGHEQRVMVTAALVKVLGAAAPSPEKWVLMSVLDGGLPVLPEHKRKAGMRPVAGVGGGGG